MHAVIQQTGGGPGKGNSPEPDRRGLELDDRGTRARHEGKDFGKGRALDPMGPDTVDVRPIEFGGNWGTIQIPFNKWGSQHDDVSRSSAMGSIDGSDAADNDTSERSKKLTNPQKRALKRYEKSRRIRKRRKRFKKTMR